MASTSPLDILAGHRPKGMSCERIMLAVKAGGEDISRSAVEHWLSGRRPLSLYAFNTLARIFDVPADEQQLGRLMLQAEWERESSKPPKRAAA